MKHTFWAELKPCIEFDDVDFDYIKNAAAIHYDAKVQATVEVGGFLYGFSNRREWSKGEDKVLELTDRQMQLIMKSIEFDNSEIACRISKRLWAISKELRDKSEEINKQFND